MGPITKEDVYRLTIVHALITRGDRSERLITELQSLMRFFSAEVNK